MNSTNKRATPTQYQLILNWDGAPTGFTHYPMAPEQFAHFAVGQFVDTQIDAIFWCASEDGNTVSWKSDQFELYGEGANFTEDRVQNWRYMANVKHWVDSGLDVPRVIAEACRQRRVGSFFSLRVNDIHDAQGGMHAPKIKRENPHWMHGKGSLASTGLNYVHFGVREYKKALIKEFFEKFDFDGLELDWLRGEVNLPEWHEYQHRYAITDFITDLRSMLDEMGRKRGRPIELAARVPETIEGCLLAGLDVPKWIDRHLIDHLIVGNMAVEFNLRPFKTMCDKAAVRLYPCLYGWGNGYNPNPGTSGPCPDDMIRGTAAKCWAQNADGLYLFNMYPTEGFRMDLMKQIGSPQTLEGLSKRFAAEVSSRDPIHFKNLFYYSPLPVSLDRTHGLGPTIPVTVTDDVERAHQNGSLDAVYIEVLFHEITPELDDIEFDFNGQPIERSDTILAKTLLGHGTELVTAYGHETWVLRPDPSRVKVGINELTVTLKHRNPAITGPLVIQRCEIVVEYRGH